ncbi:hypothetical protein [Chryseobacterium sp. A321]
MTYKTSISTCTIRPLVVFFAVLLLLFSPCSMKASVKMWVGATPTPESHFSTNRSVATSLSIESCKQSTLLSFEKSSKVSPELVKVLPVEGATFSWTKSNFHPKDTTEHSKYFNKNGFRSQVPLFLQYQKLLLAFN